MIELIFVIVILGILAAVALPRFAGVQDDAQISSERSGIGSIRSSLQAVRGKAIVNATKETNVTILDNGGLYYRATFTPNVGRGLHQVSDRNLSLSSYPNALSTVAWNTGSGTQSSAPYLQPQVEGDNTDSVKGTTALNIVLEPEGRDAYLTLSVVPATGPTPTAPQPINAASGGGLLSYITGPATRNVTDPNAELCLGKYWAYNSLAGTIQPYGACLPN
jgi:type II secretory pathway pseudopilin PulG